MITEDGEQFFLQELETNETFKEPTLADLIGLSYWVDDGLKKHTYDVFFDRPVALNDLAVHREVFDLFQEESAHRPYYEIHEKIDYLWTHAETKEEAIAADVLYWALYEDADWVLDEHIEESKTLSEVE